MPLPASSSATPSLTSWPKIASGLVLGGDDRRLQLDAHVVGAAGGHQRELVQRQRPRHAAGATNAMLLRIAALDVLDQPVQRLVHAAVVDRDRMPVARVERRAEREHERVVLELRAALGVDDLPLGLDPAELVRDELGADVGDDRRERIAGGGA